MHRSIHKSLVTLMCVGVVAAGCGSIDQASGPADVTESSAAASGPNVTSPPPNTSDSSPATQAETTAPGPSPEEGKATDAAASFVPPTEFDYGTGRPPELCDPRNPIFADPVGAPEPTGSEVVDGGVAAVAEFVNALGQVFRVKVEARDETQVLEFFDHRLCMEIVQADPGSGEVSDSTDPGDVLAAIEEQAQANGDEDAVDFLGQLREVIAVEVPAEARVILFDLEAFGPDDDPSASHVGHFYVDPYVANGASDIYSPRRSTYLSAQLYVSAGRAGSWIRVSQSWSAAASGSAYAAQWTRNMQINSSGQTAYFLHVYGWGANTTYSVYGTWRSESFSK
jgi:hypothetical protein